MKIGIIGVGSVGGAIASAIVMGEMAGEVGLFDVDAKRLKSACLDLSHAAAFGRGVRVTAGGGYSAIKGADIVVISAGANQKIGESRVNLAGRNAAVMHDVVPKIMRVVDCKKVILIVVSNPLDSMVMVAQKISKLPKGRVIGTGTMLDSARFRAEVAAHFNVSPGAVDASVLGEHGDSSVLNWAGARAGDVPISDFAKEVRIPFSEKTKAEICARVKGAAMEIIQGRGATWDGIAAATVDLIRAINNDERRVLTASIACGAGIAFSMPRIVGRNGVSSTVAPVMDAAEKRGLAVSIKVIRRTCKAI
ncbi:MAG: hypothetical protein LBQ49_02020 [Rickettsiales bacterium]|jgi:L-lactate dehydrogenase|nr:hypothetical protein [Rickettsiales bacterium]